MIEGSGSIPLTNGFGSIPLTNGSVSIPLTNGPGSRRPKNTWVRYTGFGPAGLPTTNLEMQGSPVHITQGMHNNMIYCTSCHKYAFKGCLSNI